MDYTLLFRKAIHAIFIYDKKVACYGITLGFVYSFLLNLFTPTLIEIESIDMSSINLAHLIALGIITMAILSRFTKSKEQSELIFLFKRLDADTKAGRVSETQKRMLYNKTYNYIISNLKINEKARTVQFEKD